MTNRHSKRAPDLIVGPLPVDTINRAIGTELEPGDVVFTRGAQVHASRKHPEYQVCLPHLGSVVLRPLYIGDDHRNPGKIELISRVLSLKALVLVAVSIEADERGRYRVCSIYSITEKKLQSRREKGFLFTVP